MGLMGFHWGEEGLIGLHGAWCDFMRFTRLSRSFRVCVCVCVGFKLIGLQVRFVSFGFRVGSLTSVVSLKQNGHPVCVLRFSGI